MNETATYAFMDQIEACKTALSKIHEAVDNHLNVDPDLVSWANVGDAARIEGALHIITEMLQ